MKYVKFEDDSFVLFPNSMGHNEVIQFNKKAVSAGFCDIRVDDGDYKITVYGNSHSLKIESDKTDEIRMGIMLSAR